MIEIDDIVKLKKTSEYYSKWRNFTFRVIDSNTDENNNKARIVRNMRNENVGGTNHYIKEEHKHLEIVKKNKKSRGLENEKIETKTALENLGFL